jgi:hypothetical protein
LGAPWAVTEIRPGVIKRRKTDNSPRTIHNLNRANGVPKNEILLIHIDFKFLGQIGGNLIIKLIRQNFAICPNRVDILAIW